MARADKAGGDYRRLFSRALAAAPDRLHFAAHSHHLWPDCSAAAQSQYWDDSARLADDKWDVIFESVIPAARAHVARVLSLPDPDTIAFAPNTHEFISRLLSALPDRPRIITTDGEFHSLNRQLKRLEEDGRIQVTRIPTEPFHDFTARAAAAIASTPCDMVFMSHVFFNSGFAVPDIGTIVNAVTNPDTFIVIDGYHAFMALPVDLSPFAGRIFYMGGGYKYAMAGEGCAFLHCPPGYGPRPRNTGWFADMGALESAQDGTVSYAADGFRFWGATFDPSGLYRLNAVMDVLAAEGIGVNDIHAHVIALQDLFLSKLSSPPGPLLTPAGTDMRGHFLTFVTPDAGKIADALAARHVIVDHRADRLRFGFGLYHVAGDVENLTGILADIY